MLPPADVDGSGFKTVSVLLNNLGGVITQWDARYRYLYILNFDVADPLSFTVAVQNQWVSYNNPEHAPDQP